MNIRPDKQPSFIHPARVICASFAILILIGTFFLMLPVASKTGIATPLEDALFTATSATCVTGLVVYDTYQHWSIFGQIIILTLIQLGGLGLVTFSTFFNILIGRKLGLRSMHLARESGNFENFGDVNKLIKFIVVVSLCIEAVGAILLSTVFVPKHGIGGIFTSIFLSISSFCNAGFDVLGMEGAFTSLTGYNSSFIVMLVIPLLIMLGGMGFVVLYDLMNYRKTKILMLHTKIVLIGTGILIALGTIMFLAFEWTNPATMGQLNFTERIAAGFFQSVSTRTAGFNSIDIASMRDITKFGAVLLMFIGAAPGSTAGGIKITTMTVLLMSVICVIKGRDDTVILKRRVDHKVVYKAMTVLTIAFVLVVVCATAIYFTESITHPEVSVIDVIFEEVSAFGTVGLSTGVTAQANPLAKLMLIFSMYMGRVGPVSIALSLALRPDTNKKEIIPDGKIMVG